MTELELDELGPAAELALTPDQGRLLAASGVVSATPSPYDSGRWLVGPAGKVGAARVGDVVVRIKPKVEIARLLFMLGYSLHGAAWQPSAVDVGEAPDLVPAIAQALWRQVSRAIYQGLLPGYVVREESSLVLRGRLLESAQLARHHGQPLPLEIRYDEFTVDIPENQILRTACERMLLVPRVEAESSRMLRRLLRDFADVGSIRRGDAVPAWQPTRINVRYHTALRLAELVLRATSAEHDAGAVAVSGFLLDMAQLFEDFVTVALREAIEDLHGGRVVGQSRHYLDEAGRALLKPDIVWRVGGKVGGGGRREVQGREAIRLPERGSLPAAGLLHGSGASRWPPRVRGRERAASPLRHPPGGHGDHVPRPESQRAAGSAPHGGRPFGFRGSGLDTSA